MRVPATFLWPARTEEVRANALIQRLRFSWLLILQLLALALAVLAFAGPQIKQRGLTGEATVFVIDASASMGATDVSPNRFEDAKNQVRDAIRSAKAGDRIAVIEAGPSPRVIVALSNDAGREILALDKLRRYDSEVDVGGALRLGSALVGSLESGRIVLLSDGDFEAIKDFAPGKAAVVYRKIGVRGDNLAISAFGTTDTPAGRQLYCAITNTGNVPMEAPVTITADGHLIDSEKATVAPGKTWGKTLSAPATAKVLEVNLDVKDTLAADNYAVTIANPGASLHVLLLTKGNIFLERALALDPRVTLDKTTELPAALAPYDLVVFDGIPEKPVPSRGVLTLGQAGPNSPVTARGEIDKPQFVSTSDTPLMKGVDLQDVYIERAQRVEAKAEGETVMLGNKGPLVVLSRGSQRHVYVAFEPLKSDLPLQASFPIFIANALDFLSGEASSNILGVKAGASFAIPTKSTVHVESPDGTGLNVEPTGGNAVIRSLDTFGHYRLSVGSQKKDVYASLRSERESDVRPVDNVSLGGGQVKAVPAPMRLTDFWRPLGLILLLVLSGEWWLFARRS